MFAFERPEKPYRGRAAQTGLTSSGNRNTRKRVKQMRAAGVSGCASSFSSGRGHNHR